MSILFKTDYMEDIISLRNIKGSGIFGFVNSAAISERFFDRSRAWFTQSLNDNVVNRKPISYTPEEVCQNKASTCESHINFAPGITKQRPAKSSSPALLPHGGNAAQSCPPPCRAHEAPEENHHIMPQGFRPMRWAAAQVDEPAPSTPSRNGSPLTSPAGRPSYRAETAVAGPGLRPPPEAPPDPHRTLRSQRQT